MSGNLISRFTDFLTTDGEKPWRNRDSEFVHELKSRTEILQYWDEAWNVLFECIDNLKPEDYQSTVLIRAESHTVFHALIRQLAHHASHVGQIIFLAKFILGAKWESLSIPVNQSEAFNAAYFAKHKGK